MNTSRTISSQFRTAWLACWLTILGCESRSIDVDAANALVPDKHKYKLRFEAREISSGLKHRVRYLVPVPKGWKIDGGNLEPTDWKANGTSSMSIDSSCDRCLLARAMGSTSYTRSGLVCEDSACTVQDWNQLIESEIEDDRNHGVTFIRDELMNGRRILVSLGTKGAWIRVYWWTDGAPEYHTCSARLDEHLVDSASAFVKACELAIAQ